MQGCLVRPYIHTRARTHTHTHTQLAYALLWLTACTACVCSCMRAHAHIHIHSAHTHARAHTHTQTQPHTQRVPHLAAVGHCLAFGTAQQALASLATGCTLAQCCRRGVTGCILRARHVVPAVKGNREAVRHSGHAQELNKRGRACVCVCVCVCVSAWHTSYVTMSFIIAWNAALQSARSQTGPARSSMRGCGKCR